MLNQMANGDALLDDVVNKLDAAKGAAKVLVLVHLPEVRPPLDHRHLLVAAREKGGGRSISKT